MVSAASSAAMLASKHLGQRAWPIRHPEALPVTARSGTSRLQRSPSGRWNAASRDERFAEARTASSRGRASSGGTAASEDASRRRRLKQVIVTFGAYGLFYDTRDLCSASSQHVRPVDSHDGARNPGPVMTADLLVLDDLGAEKTSEWVEETMNSSEHATTDPDDIFTSLS